MTVVCDRKVINLNLGIPDSHWIVGWDTQRAPQIWIVEEKKRNHWGCKENQVIVTLD